MPIALILACLVFVSGISFAADAGRIAPIIAFILSDDTEQPQIQNDGLAVELGGVDSSLNVLDNDTDQRDTDVINFGGPNEENAIDLKPGGVVTAASGALISISGDGQLTYDGSAIQPLTSGTDTVFYQVLVSGRVQTAQVSIRYGEQPNAIDDDFMDVSGSEGILDTQVPTPNLISNDVAGVPGATITGFGGGDLSGLVTDNLAGSSVALANGTLTIDANGSITLVPGTDPLSTGTFTFSYRLQNNIGFDDADVEILIINVPDAQDDTFTFRFDQEQNNPSNLFNDNSNGADSRGAPAGTIASFGGGSLGGSVITNTAGASVGLAGGILTVSADGSWSLSDSGVGRSFTSGEFTFSYRLENSAGFSDGLVTLNIQTPPIANDDIVANASAPDTDFHTAFNTTNVVTNNDSRPK